MSTTIQIIEGTECIGDSLPKINNNFSELAKFVAPGYTITEISSRYHAVNTTGKESGKIIFDTSNNRLLVSSGNIDDHPWYTVDGYQQVTPV